MAQPALKVVDMPPVDKDKIFAQWALRSRSMRMGWTSVAASACAAA